MFQIILIFNSSIILSGAKLHGVLFCNLFLVISKCTTGKEHYKTSSLFKIIPVDVSTVNMPICINEINSRTISGWINIKLAKVLIVKPHSCSMQILFNIKNDYLKLILQIFSTNE